MLQLSCIDSNSSNNIKVFQDVITVIRFALHLLLLFQLAVLNIITGPFNQNISTKRAQPFFYFVTEKRSMISGVILIGQQKKNRILN